MTVAERSPDLSTRAAAWVFVLVVIVAVPVIFHARRDQWFFLDEWDFLADRGLTSPDSLLRPHNEHWSTVPIVLYRLVWQVVGLNHYWPYLSMTVAAHLAVAALLLVVMRRAGVHPWIATAAASLFALFGAGRENIGWAFQIGFTGALALGLIHLVLTDHDGPFGRRDVIAVLVAVVGLSFSAIGITMTVATTVAILLRRGWRVAAAFATPLAVTYGVWWLAYGRGSQVSELATDGRGLRMAVDVATSTFENLGAVGAVGTGIAVAGLVGILLRVRGESATEVRRVLAPTCGLLAGSVCFVALTGVARAAVAPGTTSRYTHVFAALVLPAVAAGVTELGRRWQPATWVAVAVLAAGIPVNVGRLEPSGSGRFTLGAEAEVLAVANTPAPPGAPASVRPFGLLAPGVTVGWLADARAEGKVPGLTDEARAHREWAELLLALESVPGRAGERCVPLRAYTPAQLRPGQLLRVPAERVTVVEVVDGRPSSAEASYASDLVGDQASVPGDDGAEVRLRAHRGIVLQLRAPGARRPAEVCDGA